MIVFCHTLIHTSVQLYLYLYMCQDISVCRDLYIWKLLVAFSPQNSLCSPWFRDFTYSPGDRDLNKLPLLSLYSCYISERPRITRMQPKTQNVTDLTGKNKFPVTTFFKCKSTFLRKATRTVDGWPINKGFKVNRLWSVWSPWNKGIYWSDRFVTYKHTTTNYLCSRLN